MPTEKQVDDWLTERLLLSEQRFREHPELFTIVVKCSECKLEESKTFPEHHVRQYTDKCQTNVMIRVCDKCRGEEDDREEDGEDDN